MEQKENAANNLSWREAIIEVLKKSSKPMSSVEIVAAIKERELRNVTGNTPEATVGAQIYSSIKRDGEGSPFVQPAPNQFAFKQPTVSVGVPQQPNGGIIPKNDEEEPKKASGIIRAFGMYWNRDSIEWKSSPRILGSLSDKAAEAVDFCNQRGVYFLHDGGEVIYVGRALERPLGTRLFEHTFDRLKGRWNRFSWFGLVNLSEDGKIIEQGLKTVTANVGDIIITMEALLIEGLEPKQNRKRGDTGFIHIEYIQIEDPIIQQKKMKEVLDRMISKI
ncbi:MAG TPA: HTH domain-containing protein [Candidatus Baltobacteraceae bacterium]|jgi:hypothetical protein|nr:HTH domain-containing protein [Candidatus Baltobacteraceae bacterium]